MPVTCHAVIIQSMLLYQALDDPASKLKSKLTKRPTFQNSVNHQQCQKYDDYKKAKQ